MSQDLWSFCLSRLEHELPPQQFNTWIKTLQADEEKAGASVALRLVAPSRFVLQWVRERYLRRIGELGAEFHGAPIEIELVLPAAGAARPAARPVIGSGPVAG
ncbi:DnaA N-terminal domain-containing protein, partial [Aromatoleum aromaticum]|nr:chromosomal replication initiator protein DnaA [Aromatoleum aromaticum]